MTVVSSERVSSQPLPFGWKLPSNFLVPDARQSVLYYLSLMDGLVFIIPLVFGAGPSASQGGNVSPILT